MPRHIDGGSSFERDYAYSRAVAEGAWVFVSGTTGFDYARGSIVADVAGQAEQALRTIDAALREAGASIADVLRVRYILPGGAADFALCAPVLRHWFGAHPPAATMLVAGLLDPRMRIEIEATARRPG